VLVAECFAFAFDAKDKLLVVDIDGTITKSDVQGLLMTFRYTPINTHSNLLYHTLLLYVVSSCIMRYTQRLCCSQSAAAAIVWHLSVLRGGSTSQQLRL
jgi:hypothetical protein